MSAGSDRGSTPPSAAAEALWGQALERWEEDATHAAFLEHCADSGELPFAARCYREHARAPAGDDAESIRERADESLAAIQSRALAALQTTSAEPGPRRGCRAVMVVFSVAFLLTVLMLVGLFLR